MAVKASDPSKVINDFKNWVNRIEDRAERKVRQAVADITNKTNNQYSADNIEQRVQLKVDPIYYKISEGKGLITGIAAAKPIPEFIYLEFGTRQSSNQTLTIRNDWDSGINAPAVALPYRSDNPSFYIPAGPIHSRYYFLNNIDNEGRNFLRNFWK